MWTEIKSLSTPEVIYWMDKLDPVEGKTVDFNGLQVIDIDLFNALSKYEKIIK